MAGSKRQTWVDVAEIFALFLVVVGHPITSTHYTKYIFWFQHTVFFLLSGYLFKPVASWSSLRSWLRNRSRELLLPYTVYLVLFNLVTCCYVYRDAHWLSVSKRSGSTFGRPSRVGG